MDSIEAIINQIDDDASVIGYKPKLEYQKDRTATDQAVTSSDVTDINPEDDESLYSKTLNSFATAMPSSVLDDIAYVLKNIKRLKKELANKFNIEQALSNNPYYNVNSEPLVSGKPGISNTTASPESYSSSKLPSSTDTEIIINNNNTGRGYNPYNDINTLIDAGETGDTDYTRGFAEQYNTPYGSVIPGLINLLTDIEGKLNELNTDFKTVYYNNPTIQLSDAKSIDNSYLKDLRVRERHNDTAGINYMTLSFDSILNKTISYCVLRDNKNAIKVAKVIDSQEDTQATTNDMDIINKLFDDVNKKLDLRARGYKRQEDVELIQKSLYNYYEKRKYLNDLYELRNKDKKSVYLGRKVDKYADELTESIKDIDRVLMYNQNNLDQITILEKEKYNIQKICKSISKKSSKK